MTFLEVQFPPNLAFGSTGGPERRTEVVTLGSGFEERNSSWVNSRRRYDATRAIERENDVYAILELWEAASGKLRGFRFRDPFDFKSRRPGDPVTPADQALGLGAGSSHTYQLKKTYARGGETWTRDIRKPVRGSIKLAVAGVAKVEGSDFTVDYTTGEVTINATNLAAITVGFEFDVPVRFDTDKLDLTLTGFRSGQIPQIPLVEIKV